MLKLNLGGPEDLEEEGVGGKGVGSDDVGEGSAAGGIWWRRTTLRISVGPLVPIPSHVLIAEECSRPGCEYSCPDLLVN